MIDIREILVRIFSAIFLSMCTGSCMFVFWMVLRKFFADKICPKVYDLILKIILIAYYVPAGYLLVNIFFDNGYVFDFTGTIMNAFYAISLFWLAGAIATVLKFGERTFRIRREKERCFPCKMYVQKIFEDCKKELGIRRSIEVLQGYCIQIPMTAGILKPCVFLPVEDMEEEQLKTCIYHELTHYKKHDIFWNYIACLMVCIHWYCPWIRTVFRKNDEWSEVICDLSAIGYVGSAKRYFTTIFEMSQKSQGIKAYRAACLFESRDSLEQRIYYAMMYRKQKKIKYAAVIAMTVIFCGMSVTSTLAVSKGYQKVYTKWVQETEIEEEAEIVETEEMKKRLYVEILVIFSMIILCCSVKEIYADDNMDVVCEEKVDTKENIVEEEEEQQEFMEILSNQILIDWSVKNGVRKESKQFYKKKDSLLKINLQIKPETQSVKVGYLDADGVKHYKSVKSKINSSIKIQSSGNIKFFVENSSGKSVTVKGYYIK